MNYARSKQQREGFSKNVLKNFTDACGGDPFELFDILQGKYTVDDFAYHDDWYYFGVTDYMNKVIVPHKIAVFMAGKKMLNNPSIDRDLSQSEKEEFEYNLWVHDLSKFSADEVFGYAMYNRETGSGKEQFEKAWHHHKMHNPHHPEYWLNPSRSGELEALPIPNIYSLEMIADWIGAGETYGTPLSTWAVTNLPKFKFKNRSKIAELIQDYANVNAKMQDNILVVEPILTVS